MQAVSDWFDRNSLYLALLAAWIATAGSLYFSEVLGFVPCQLCWYQRILMYPLALLLTIGLLRRDRHLPLLVLPFALLGLGLATYHYLLEKTDLFRTAGVCAGGVSCTTAWINWWGFVTIPFLSLVGFLVITVMTAIALQAQEPDEERLERPPWLPVVGISAVTLLAFGLLAQLHRPTEAAPATFPVLAADAATAQSRLSAAPSAPELLAQGERLYDEACASCHGANGEGVPNLGTPLAGAVYLQATADAAVLAFLRAGRGVDSPDNRSGLPMPPSGGRPDLTDPELQAIIAYLRTLPQE
jgi:disulfide bond formation protein DsbB